MKQALSVPVLIVHDSLYCALLVALLRRQRNGNLETRSDVGAGSLPLTPAGKSSKRNKARFDKFRCHYHRGAPVSAVGLLEIELKADYVMGLQQRVVSHLMLDEFWIDVDEHANSSRRLAAAIKEKQ
ncbi:unnamed protein product [Angiostrongylus costaricensis]|uniref:Uncharacterized protein n=1 Tax=Angiostrongylus costaricensis TaxID=334426 RepID=A0A158PJQ4_ANGCS|nr:unnamed protein product [Angiostrongylus costaricensis]